MAATDVTSASSTVTMLPGPGCSVLGRLHDDTVVSLAVVSTRRNPATAAPLPIGETTNAILVYLQEPPMSIPQTQIIYKLTQ